MNVTDWVARAREELARGVRPTVGEICPDCLGLVPRVPETRTSLEARMCACGPTTTTFLDLTAHGIDPFIEFQIPRHVRTNEGESR